MFLSTFGDFYALQSVTCDKFYTSYFAIYMIPMKIEAQIKIMMWKKQDILQFFVF